MSAAALAPAPARTIGWEIHRPHGGRRVAVAFYGDAEAVRLTGPLLRIRVAAWSWLLGRYVARSRRPSARTT
jgi:hypothetical protein